MLPLALRRPMGCIGISQSTSTPRDFNSSRRAVMPAKSPFGENWRGKISYTTASRIQAGLGRAGTVDQCVVAAERRGRAPRKAISIGSEGRSRAMAFMASNLPGFGRSFLGGYLGENRSEEHTSELQSLRHLVCRLLLEKK